jgi:hypothetical protein
MTDQDILEEFRAWARLRRLRRRLFWRAAGHLSLAMALSMAIAAGVWAFVLLTVG